MSAITREATDAFTAEFEPSRIGEWGHVAYCLDRAVECDGLVRLSDVTAWLRSAPTPCDLNLYGPAADALERQFGAST